MKVVRSLAGVQLPEREFQTEWALTLKAFANNVIAPYSNDSNNNYLSDDRNAYWHSGWDVRGKPSTDKACLVGEVMTVSVQNLDCQTIRVRVKIRVRIRLRSRCWQGTVDGSFVKSRPHWRQNVAERQFVAGDGDKLSPPASSRQNVTWRQIVAVLRRQIVARRHFVTSVDDTLAWHWSSQWIYLQPGVSWKEQKGEEDPWKYGWMMYKNGTEYSIYRADRTKNYGQKLWGQQWTPTGIEPMDYQ